MKILGKITLVSLALVILGGSVWVGVGRSRRHYEIKAKLEEAIGRDAGYTETILKSETDSNHMTFGEFFNLCDKSVEARTNLIIELRGLYPSISNSTKDKLIEFLNAENDAVRSKRDLYRKSMLLSTSLDSALSVSKNRPYSEYGWDFYRSQIKQANQEVIDAAVAVQTSGVDFAQSYERALSMETGVATAAGNAGIRFKPIFKDYDQENRSDAKKKVDSASEIATKMQAIS